MSASTDFEFAGVRGKVVGRRWLPRGTPPAREPGRIVLLAHGYGEHSGRYEHVAAALTGDGAAVYAPDHYGHGRSEGEMALVYDVDEFAADLDQVRELAVGEHPGLPVVVLGHSMGGVIATRYVQLHPDVPAALVLSGPVIGGNPAFTQLLDMDPIPDVPIDPATLSRDRNVGEAYANDPLVYHGPFKRETLMALGSAVEEIASGGRFGDLPVLWMHGGGDQLVPYDATSEAFRNVRGNDTVEHVYPGAAHEIFNETNKDEVLGHLSAWLAEKVPAGAPAR